MSDELDKDAKVAEVDTGQVQNELSTQELDHVAGGQIATPPAVSNIMKTKHDTVKNSISNIR